MCVLSAYLQIQQDKETRAVNPFSYTKEGHPSFHPVKLGSKVSQMYYCIARAAALPAVENSSKDGHIFQHREMKCAIANVNL